MLQKIRKTQVRVQIARLLKNELVLDDITPTFTGHEMTCVARVTADDVVEVSSRERQTSRRASRALDRRRQVGPHITRPSSAANIA